MFWSEKFLRRWAKRHGTFILSGAMRQQYTNAKILLLIDVFGGIVRRKYFYYCAQGALKKES